MCLQVFLSTSQCVHVDVKSCDSSTRALEEVARLLNLPSNLVPYLGLFVIQWNDRPASCASSTNSSTSAASSSGTSATESKDFRLMRRLQAFESPFLTLSTLNNLTGRRHSLTIRTNYWDTAFDQELLSSDAGLNLLFQQTVTDVSQGSISLSKEAKHQLRAFQAGNCQKQYMELGRTLKFYSYLHFENCICDYPELDSTVTISLGGRELLIRPLDCSNFCGPGPKEISFKVTRIRCWRLVNSIEGMLSRPSDGTSKLQKLELTFEYLMNKDNLRWITVESDQAVLISMSLQGIVDELLMKRKGLTYASSNQHAAFDAQNRHNSAESSSQQSMKTISREAGHSSPDSIFSPNGHVNGNHANGIKYNVRKLVENDAFEGIGDDDL